MMQKGFGFYKRKQKIQVREKIKGIKESKKTKKAKWGQEKVKVF